MSTKLDLHDIQGNIIKGYGRFGFPKARYIFYRIKKGDAGRKFILDLIPKITTSVPWTQNGSEKDGTKKPKVTTNIAFTYEGFKKLGIPEIALHSFPDEFSMGMKARQDILGDDGVSAPHHWDPIWQSKEPVHLFISINGETLDDIKGRYQEICQFVEQSSGGVEQLKGHRGEDGDNNLPYQEASALFKNGMPTPKEHFGYTDGISDPYFKGSGANPANVIGRGKLAGGDPNTSAGWAPLETGEFLLGHKDEAFEYPKAPIPRLLSHNGTFMVYRKLHENVGSFNTYLEKVGESFPGGKEALAAKFAGRWRNGAPITTFPTAEEANQFAADLSEARKKAYAAAEETKKAALAQYFELRTKLRAFDFNKDLPGSRCPVGAHIRRLNPRGSLEYGKKGAYETPGALANRRRIARRGLPYGEVKDQTKDDGNHGIIFMALNADIKRQFEFVQQQWINYGNDFKLANDKDPILGNHGTNENGDRDGRMVIEADPKEDKPPFFCSNLPRFVETRGGDYFFIPSLTALRMIGDGIIDPT